MTEEQVETQEEKKESDVCSPIGLTMLSIGIILDFLGTISVLLFLSTGIGLVLAKIIYAMGLIIVFGWMLSRGKIAKKKKGVMKMILKKYGKKIALKGVPVIGDALPLWTITIYAELNEKSLLSKVL